MLLLWIKALHLIAVIAWRLFRFKTLMAIFAIAFGLGLWLGGAASQSSRTMRLFNEASLFLVVPIILLAVVKPF